MNGRDIMIEKKFSVVEGGMDRLKAICDEALVMQYSADAQPEATKRLEWELSAIEKTDSAFVFLYLRDMIATLGLKGYEYMIRGTAGSSIVAYLCGISKVDPFEYDLSPEFVFGFNGNKELNLDINIPEAYLPAAKTLYEGIDGIKAVIELENDERSIPCKRLMLIPDGSDIPIVRDSNDEWELRDSFFVQNILTCSGLDMMEPLFKTTGVNPEDISLNDEKVISFFNGYDESEAYFEGIPGFEILSSMKSEDVYKPENILSVLKDCKAGSYTDFARAQSLVHGTGVWIDNQDQLVRSGIADIGSIITDREDVFDLCIAKGFDREFAFKVAEDVRRGKAAKGKSAFWDEAKNSLLAVGTPEWYVKACEKIEYLFPRAHSLSNMLRDWYLAWFKVHYPDEFKQIISDKKCHLSGL